MKRIPLSENFFVDEFCPKEIHELIEIGDAKLSDYQDERIPVLVQWIRTRKGESVTANNYAKGGELDERGIRMPNTSTGASKSRHKYEAKEGKVIRKSDAIDINIGTMTAKEMYDWAKENMVALHGLGVRCVEHYSLTGGYGNGWLHMDMRPLKQANEIIIVDLKKVVETWKIW